MGGRPPASCERWSGWFSSWRPTSRGSPDEPLDGPLAEHADDPALAVPVGDGRAVEHRRLGFDQAKERALLARNEGGDDHSAARLNVLPVAADECLGLLQVIAAFVEGDCVAQHLRA